MRGSAIFDTDHAGSEPGGTVMTLVDIASVPDRILAPGFRARLMHGASLTIMRVQIDAGSHLPRHQHPHEQATTILSGRLQLTVGETLYDMGPGMTVFIP